MADDEIIGLMWYTKYTRYKGVKKMKLKTRFKIAMIGMLTVVVVLNTATILFYISSSLKDNAAQSMESVNEQKMVTIENLLDTFVTLTQKPLIDETILEILRKDYSEIPEEKRRYLQYQDIDKMQDRLYTEMFYKNEYIYAVTLFQTNGERVYYKQRSSKGLLDIDLTDCDWYQKLCETDGTEALLFPYMVEDLYRGKEPVIALGRLLKNPMTNQPLGVIRIDIAVTDLEKVCKSNVDEDSNVVFLTDKDELLYTSFETDDWKAEYDEKLETNFAVTTFSDRYGVSITTMLPQNKVYRKAYETILIILGIALGCIGTALFVAEFIVKQSMKPVGELNGLMKEVRSGDLSVRAKVQSGGEFEEICESFNLMVENTEHLIERVRQEEYEKMESEYKALQAQISPHFILNTLNTIKWMAVIQGNKSIEKSLDSFSHLLSFVVRRKEEKIPIQAELEQMKYYVDILSLRYYNKFQIDFEVEPGVEKCCTIKFLLQTLVENSVFHGFDEMMETGKIQVRIRRQDNKIIYEVEDNGKGISAERIKEILSHASEEKKGMVKIGLYNINRRIQLIFGEQYGVSIESRLGEYTIVRVVIPAEEEENGEDNHC